VVGTRPATTVAGTTSAATDQVALEGTKPAPVGGHRMMSLTETAPDLDNLEALPFGTDLPGGSSALLQWSRGGTTIRSAFSMLPEEHPIGLLRRPSPDTRSRTDAAYLAYTPRVRPGEPPQKTGAPAPPKRPGFHPCRRSGKPAARAGSPQAGQVASAPWPVKQVRGCLPK
jgi:hypothetical protein